MKQQRIDTVILGCTHYAFLTPLVRTILGPSVCLIDPADYVLGALASHGICQTARHDHRFEVSGDPRCFQVMASHLLGQPVAVKRVVPAMNALASPSSRCGADPVPKITAAVRNTLVGDCECGPLKITRVHK